MPESGANPVPAHPLHPISRHHLVQLAGPLGIFQHAIGSRPDPEHGYCVDDVARALQVDVLHARTLGWPEVAASARRNMTFLEAAFDADTGRLMNFRRADGGWVDGLASEDSFGRAMLALGETIAGAPDARIVDRATSLLRRALPAATRVTFLRAQAAIVLACAAASGATSITGSTDDRDLTVGVEAAGALRHLAIALHVRIRDTARPGWPWPEPTLTYENALVPRALIVAGARLQADAMLGMGLRVLDWLIEVQSAPDGHFSPIGNGWWPRGGTRSQFDQQPIEATALLLAAEAAYVATGEPRYLDAMELSYAWFLGANDLGKPVAAPARGSSADGLTAGGLNTNEGAESTLMWLVAAEHIRAMRAQPQRARPARSEGSAAGTAAVSGASGVSGASPARDSSPAGPRR